MNSPMNSPDSGSNDNPATPTLTSPSTWSWSSLIETTQRSAAEFADKAITMAESASKVAQEKAVLLALKAQELQQNYDMEVATSILLNSIGASPFDNDHKSLAGKNSSKQNKLDLVYVTENIISMGFPNDPKNPIATEGGNNINVIAAFLMQRHNGHFMIWNVSEESYNYGMFSDQVLEYKFPGHPSPPLGLLFKICTAVESWLDADVKNVAVVHCLTGILNQITYLVTFITQLYVLGKGRTATLIACILTWIGEFDSPMEALQYVADRKNITIDNLTIPSQRRYVSYFSNMLDGVKPRPEALLLRRVILNGIPIFGDDNAGEDNRGCAPYLQLFKCGRLIATAVPAGSRDASNQEDKRNKDNIAQLKWIQATEGSVSFPVDCAVQGDILLRVRHAASNGARVSMFRAAFHTGYVPCGVLRLTKAQLDGSCGDARFDDDFFIDLIFAPVEKALPTSLPSSSSNQINDSGLIIDSNSPSTDKYEMSLHKDTRFWDAVSVRKSKSKKRSNRKFAINTQEQFSISDDLLNGTPSEVKNNLLSSEYSKIIVSRGNSISDADLIMQLAEAEEDSSSTREYPKSKAENVEVSNTITSSANVELEALEELERELGLEFLKQKNDTSANSNEGVPSIKNNNNTDDLEELEKYLQSLS